MARKRRAPNYTGALAQPIYLEDHYKFTGGLGQPIQEPDVAAIRSERWEKMPMLFEHYKIDPSDEQSWRKLAMSLALAHVPGLQVVNRPKPGRKSTWKAGLGDELVRAIDDVKSRTGMRTKDAIAELGGRWKTYTRQHLAARYWEALRRQGALASLQEDWKKGIVFGVDLAALRPHEVTGRPTKIGAHEKTLRRKLVRTQKRSR